MFTLITAQMDVKKRSVLDLKVDVVQVLLHYDINHLLAKLANCAHPQILSHKMNLHVINDGHDSSCLIIYESFYLSV